MSHLPFSEPPFTSFSLKKLFLLSSFNCFSLSFSPFQVFGLCGLICIESIQNPCYENYVHRYEFSLFVIITSFLLAFFFIIIFVMRAQELMSNLVNFPFFVSIQKQEQFVNSQQNAFRKKKLRLVDIFSCIHFNKIHEEDL